MWLFIWEWLIREDCSEMRLGKGQIHMNQAASLTGICFLFSIQITCRQHIFSDLALWGSEQLQIIKCAVKGASSKDETLKLESWPIPHMAQPSQCACLWQGNKLKCQQVATKRPQWANARDRMYSSFIISNERRKEKEKPVSDSW